MPHLLVLLLLILEVSEFRWETIVIIIWCCLDCIQLKFAICELFVQLSNPAKTICTKIQVSFIILYFSYVFSVNEESLMQSSLTYGSYCKSGLVVVFYDYFTTINSIMTTFEGLIIASCSCSMAKYFTWTSIHVSKNMKQPSKFVALFFLLYNHLHQNKDEWFLRFEYVSMINSVMLALIC